MKTTGQNSFPKLVLCARLGVGSKFVHAISDLDVGVAL